MGKKCWKAVHFEDYADESVKLKWIFEKETKGVE
jgi:hypothetical protein